MGIRGIETAMKNCPKCIRRVKIRDLITRELENVIVDGNQFYECYLYKQFDWLHVGLKHLVKEMQTFVDSFRDLGVHLVFVFRHRFRDPGDEKMRQIWVEKRQKNVEFNNDILRSLETNEKILEERKFSDRLEHVKCFVIQFLRSMKCEVHCDIKKYGSKAMIEHASRTSALCILSQNSYLVFYDGLPKYLSIKYLDLVKMETYEYDIDALANYLRLKRKHFPLFATILGENELVNTDHPFQCARNNIRDIICASRRGSYCFAVTAYIERHWRNEGAQNFLRRMFQEDGEALVPAYEEFQSRFIINVHDEDYTHLCNQGEIIRMVKEMVLRGEMYFKIYDIVVHNLFEQYIIPEDYKTLPSSQSVFRSLRKKMYGILFQYTSKSKNKKIEEWYIDEGTCRSFLETPDPVNEELHPGLLTLWDNSSDEIIERKWILFCEAISPTLNIALLRQLPQKLVVPTAVLFYLYNEMPKCSPKCNYNFLQSWEVEAFIAQLVLFSQIRVEDSHQEEENCCARSVMLCAFFVSGCFYVNMLVQACGYPVTEYDMQIFNYFDGFLFHDLYRKVEYQGVGQLLPSEKRAEFLQIKNIVELPNI